MQPLRLLAGTTVLLLLAATLSACVVASDTTARPSYHTWYYYPAYDVYYSPSAGVWAYWTGRSWATVDSRPRWLALPPSAYYVRIDYRGPSPWMEWEYHRRYYWPGTYPPYADYYYYDPRYRWTQEPRPWRGPVDERGYAPPVDERGVTPRSAPSPQPSPRPQPQPAPRGPVDERGIPQSER